jgi:predicted outer membrane repeat protein
MKTFFTILLLSGITMILNAQIIHVPGDQPTIQAGIDAANSSDTVLVDDGTYFENINFHGKAITVGSRMIIDGSDKHLALTIIDGSQPATIDTGAAVTFLSGEDGYSVLYGCTITKGTGNFYELGGGIYCENSSPRLEHICIVNNYASSKGGGIYCLESSPILINVMIAGNVVDGNGPIPEDGRGGGMYCVSSSPYLASVTICNNSALSYGGGICCEQSGPVFDTIRRCNIYQNDAEAGKDIYSLSYFSITLDTFTVRYPTDYYAVPLKNLNLDVRHGIIPQVDADLYVSPDGNNANSGLKVTEPLKTIQHAFSIIRADSAHHHTVHLLEGTYSPSTGESYPVRVIDHISLEGSSPTGVILDAEGHGGGVLNIEYNLFNSISDMTITGNGGGYYGGINCYYSNPTLKNLIITDNIAYVPMVGGKRGTGGGISCNNASPNLINIDLYYNSAGLYGGGLYCYYSSPNLENVTIRDNKADYGGGISLDHSGIVMHHVTITGNSATGLYGDGGGIYSSHSGIIFDSTERCNIYMNYASVGNEIYSSGLIDLIIDTFAVMMPTAYHVYPYYNFSFNILHYKCEQVDADLYVSPDGDNHNSGLTPGDPLKNIDYAMSVILTGKSNHHMVNLLEGTYSPSVNGEHFPLHLPDFINLKGSSPDEVILDAGRQAGVMSIYLNTSNNISGLTITGGSVHGVVIYGSGPVFQNVKITDNVTTYGCYGGGWGGGIFCENSYPTFQNTSISNNYADVTGWGGYFNNSYVLCQNVLIIGNDLTCGASSLSLVNTTISGNPFRSVFLSSSECTVINSILWNQQGSWIILGSDDSRLNVSWSDIQGGSGGVSGNGIVNWLEGNIEEGPLFTGYGDHPFQLSTGSPCIDEGAPDTTGLLLPPCDILGNERIWDGDGDGTASIDMGAYEYGSLPVGYNSYKPQATSCKLQVFPNPGCGEVFVRYEVPVGSQVSLSAYDLHGQKIMTLVDAEQTPEEHVILFDASAWPAGIYIIRLQADARTAVAKLIRIQ